jgi:hypothetical protein
MDDSKIKFNISKLEEEFSVKKPVPVAQSVQSSGTGGTTQTAKPKVQKFSYLLPGRQQNISVVLGKVRIKIGDMMDYLIAYDTTKLSSNICELMVPILPTESELREVATYEGEIENLMECDQFCLFLNSVIGFDLRFKAIIYKNNYKKEFSDINLSIDNFIRIFVFFRTSEIIKKWLEVILAYGNYLNGTSNR